jgi:ATP adenylyltransferase
MELAATKGTQMTRLSTRPLGHEACRFCGILNGDRDDVFDSAWLSSERYRALISVGALVPGWTVVFPTAHGVNLAEHYSNPDFTAFTGHALALLRARYGRCSAFEHGAGTVTSQTGCGVGHAHLHLVPLDFPLAVEALRFAPDLEWQRTTASGVQRLADEGEYLFVADDYTGEDTVGLFARLRDPTSQFFRKLVAQRLGLAELYNYRKFPMLELACASAKEMREVARATSGV